MNPRFPGKSEVASFSFTDASGGTTCGLLQRARGVSLRRDGALASLTSLAPVTTSDDSQFNCVLKLCALSDSLRKTHLSKLGKDGGEKRKACLWVGNVSERWLGAFSRRPWGRSSSSSFLQVCMSAGFKMTTARARGEREK